ncbi:MAG: cysteine desulfurase family protein [Thermoanaerobaculia bacterium]
MADLPIYLDHHSTTPCDPRVLERMLPFFSEAFGNPASVTHQHGRRAATALEDARASVADFLRVRPAEVFFTSGATESNNTAIRGLLEPGGHAIASSIEHPSVLAPLRALEKKGVALTLLPVDREGFVDPDALREAIRPSTVLVSIMAANGEIGTIQPVAQIAEICRERSVSFHSDATQAVGKIPFDTSRMGCDLLSISAHKIYGPKGVGALVVRKGARPTPLLMGGGQEKGLRSGTVNVAGAVGLAAALELRRAEMEGEAARLTTLRNRLWDQLMAEMPDVSVNGPRELRLPGNLNVSFRGVDAEAVLFALRRFSLSTGSACSSGDREPSSVLVATGQDEASALGSIRIGMGKSSSADEMNLLVSDLKATLHRIREISAP